MTAPFDGRVALITGAGRGIGRAVALQLAEGGARVALVARSVDQLEETAATLRGEGGVALVVPADLADHDAVADAAHTVNLAAEVAGSGVTVNVYRPGSVDTAMHAWFRAQPPAEIGAALHQHFQASYEQGALITAERSARALLARLGGEATGQTWNAVEA
jgi:NAD(P)-dependent dehydrogenase (short-subunit alcohol dehydrogenase family)